MLPIFRKSDAKNNNAKNLITFDLVADLFKRKRLVMIFPEGYCVIEKRLRPLSKGTARMAFHACEKHGFDLDLKIVPAGLNYTKPFGIRGKLYYNCGEPIALNDYKELYESDPNRAIVKVTEELERRMKAIIIHVNKGLDKTAEDLFEIYGNDNKERVLPIVEHNKDTAFNIEKSIADQLNHLQSEKPEQLNQLEEQCKEYRSKLAEFKVSDALFSLNKSGSASRWIYLILLAPIWIYGFLTNFFIFRFAKNYPAKLIKSNVFYSSLRIGLIMISYWVYFLLILIILSILFSFPIALGYLLFHLIAGYSFALAYDSMKFLKERRRSSKLDDEAFRDIQKMRNEILEKLNIQL